MLINALKFIGREGAVLLHLFPFGNVDVSLTDAALTGDLSVTGGVVLSFLALGAIAGTLGLLAGALLVTLWALSAVQDALRRDR